MLKRFVRKFEDISEITGKPSDIKTINFVKDIFVELVDKGLIINIGEPFLDDYGVYVGKDSYNLDRGLLINIFSPSNGQEETFFSYNTEIEECINISAEYIEDEWGSIEKIYSYETYNDKGYSKGSGKPIYNQEITSLNIIMKKKKTTMFDRFIKKFETFEMSVYVCPRCGKDTNGITSVGIFNTDTICIPCKDKEKEDPDYQLAVDTEKEEVRKGNYNYQGIYPNYKSLS